MILVLSWVADNSNVINGHMQELGIFAKGQLVTKWASQNLNFRGNETTPSPLGVVYALSKNISFSDWLESVTSHLCVFEKTENL